MSLFTTLTNKQLNICKRVFFIPSTRGIIGKTLLVATTSGLYAAVQMSFKFHMKF